MSSCIRGKRLLGAASSQAGEQRDLAPRAPARGADSDDSCPGRALKCARAALGPSVSLSPANTEGDPRDHLHLQTRKWAPLPYPGPQPSGQDLLGITGQA